MQETRLCLSIVLLGKALCCYNVNRNFHFLRRKRSTRKKNTKTRKRRKRVVTKMKRRKRRRKRRKKRSENVDRLTEMWI